MSERSNRPGRSPVMCSLVAAAGLALFVAPAGAQVVNPATANQSPDAQEPQKPGLKTYEMPPVTVYGKAPLDEEDRIGDYAQPRWTAHRRFSETRVYVIPKGMVEFEYWLKPKVKKDGEPTEFETLYEAEFGLPKRFQLDLYAVGHKEGRDGTFALDSQKVEVRWALADWGRIWGNPTLYAEWEEASGGPDVAELKLLLGGHLVSSWHWGSNLVWEHQTGAAHETAREWTLGLSKTVRDSKIGVGVETQLALVNEDLTASTRTGIEKEFLVGPSLQFKPLPQMHIDFAPLFGTSNASPRMKAFIVLGWEL